MTEENKTTETDDHAAPEATPAPAPVETDTAHADPAMAEPAGHETGEPVAHVEPEPAVEVTPDVEPVVVPEEAAEPVTAAEPAVDPEPAPEPAPAPESEPEPAPEPTPAEAMTPPPEPIAAAAALAAASSGADPEPAKRPVWSDEGDAHDGDDGDDGGDDSDGGKSDKNEWVEIIKTVAIALFIAILLRIFLFQPFTIPSASMEPNLYEGDYIVVSKWTYGYSKHAIPYSPALFEGRIMDNAPERGDIAVFKLPSDNKTDYIKRVIGVPGDRVQMINNVLHINGEPVENVVVTGEQVADMFSDGQTVTTLRETLPGGRSYQIQDFGPNYSLDNTPVFEVPEGYYFMMGDNRDNSIDSREQSAMGVGLVPAENLIGKAEMILFSWHEGASLFNPISWFSKVRLDRFFTVLK